MAKSICKADGCTNPVRGQGLCSTHYQRWLRRGDLLSPGHTVTPAIDRLMARVVVTPGPMETPCWITNYARDPNGYIKVKIRDRSVGAHRLSYEHFVGPIPDGLCLDHLCRVRWCCNPGHLEPVTLGENVLRGNSPVAVAVRTGFCKYGHSLADAYVYPDGLKRACRTCRVLSWRKAAP